MLSLNKLEGLEKKIIIALQDISKLKSENTLLSNENSVLKKQLNSLKEKLEVKKDEFFHCERELENTRGQINEINSVTGNLDEKVDILSGKLNEFYKDGEKEKKGTGALEKSQGKKDKKTKKINSEESGTRESEKARGNYSYIFEENVDGKGNTDKTGSIEIEFSDDDFGDIIVID